MPIEPVGDFMAVGDKNMGSSLEFLRTGVGGISVLIAIGDLRGVVLPDPGGRSGGFPAVDSGVDVLVKIFSLSPSGESANGSLKRSAIWSSSSNKLSIVALLLEEDCSLLGTLCELALCQLPILILLLGNAGRLS